MTERERERNRERGRQADREIFSLSVLPVGRTSLYIFAII